MAKDERVSIVGDAAYFERILALMITTHGPVQFDPTDFAALSDFSVVVVPHDKYPEMMKAITVSHKVATDMHGKPGKGVMN
jgi:hypothetical protein